MDLEYLGQLADRLEATKDKRIAADKVAATLRTKENALKAELIELMEVNNLSSAGGKSAVISRITKTRAQAGDWNELYEFIREHDAFDLLEKRLRTPSVLLRVEDGIEVPGTYLHKYSHLTYGKART